MKILVYHSGALGDFMSAIQVFSCIRKQYKAAHIVYLGKPQHASLVATMQLFSETWDLDKQQWSSAFSNRPEKQLLAKFSEFTQAYVFAGQKSDLTKTLEKANVQSIFSLPSIRPSTEHIYAHNAQLIHHLNPSPVDSQSILLKEVKSAPLEKSGCFIAPGSGSQIKNWNLSNYQIVANALVEKGYEVTWILGPAEENLILNPKYKILRNVSLPQLAQQISKAKLYIGNDSGISHLAAAVSCSSIIIFGASDPSIWAPKGEHISILSGSCLSGPCHLLNNKASACNKECFDMITPGKVIDKAMEVLTW